MNATSKIEPATMSTALVAALAEIGGAAKDKINPAFKSKYADLGSVIDAIKPVLASHDLAFTQHTALSEDGVIVETFVRHAGGEKESLGSLYVPANKRDAQGFGSALTYCRRYSLMTAFGVPAEDDDGNAAARTYVEPTRQQKVAEHKDDPFPQGPAKNKTSLKEMGRALWRDVEACGDPEELDVLLISHDPLVKQLQAGLPMWWSGGRDREGEAFEGLGQVIERMRRDLANTNIRTVIDAG